MTDTEPETAAPSGPLGPLFGPRSLFNRLSNDPRWAMAILRATVLEAAHPQVGAALIDSSTFVAHPWRRLRNTFLSTQRMFGADEYTRQREAARLNRLHERLSGTDERSRPYDAMDPRVRAWVVATLFESAVNMCRLSGQPLAQAEMEQLYAEFQAFLAMLTGGHHGVAAGGTAGGAAAVAAEAGLPPTLPEFWRYYDRVVAEELENTEAVRIILFKLFDHLPAPPLLTGLPTVWAAGRALAGPLVGAITVASLPEPYRRRAGLPELPGAQTLMQSAYLTAGLVRFLPEGWFQAEAITNLLYLSPDSDDPRAATVAALRDRMKRAGALFRLIIPFSAGESAAGGVPHQRRGAEEFFADVLDQTGDGSLDWPDLAAMARELAFRLDLDAPVEERLYDAFAAWWRELQAALDTDGDGRVSAQEYAAAVPSLAGPALIRVAEVLFEATDADGNGYIDAEEYRALFRTGFQRTLSGATGGKPGGPLEPERYSRSAFVNDFLSFMSGRRRSTAYDPLLAQA